MHELDGELEQLARTIFEQVLERQRMNPMPLGGIGNVDVLQAELADSITPDGLGLDEAMRRWSETVIPNLIAVDHPRYLAFIPHAPTQASVFIDLFVSAASIYAGSWMEGSGAVFAENQALDWIAGLAGYPSGAGGTFVSGGTLGNLAALHTARETARDRRGSDQPARWQVAISSESHSSNVQALRVLDMDPVRVPVDRSFRLTASALRQVLDEQQPDGLCAVVASAGSTNAGAIDDLVGIAEICEELGIWLHIDGAYGLAALASPAKRDAFAGVERSDSLIVDPHKWLFGPYDSCALLYRDPRLARRAHSQSADYLDVINERNDWNPSDYAVQLSRRARGVPMWFSLMAHGSDAYGKAVDKVLALTAQTVAEIRQRPELELLLEPDLSVLLFRRVGWNDADYLAWSNALIASGTAFVVPTRVNGKSVARMVLMNPRTTLDDVRLVLDPMR
ncbi:MAG: aminotransferase class I/II-fold pyridoxal phosphate-dependent enzyme [Thermomicrobiales bacterium]